MKATGIVRKIDELGRIVIPKEIRKTMRIKEGEALEIYVEKTGEVVLKKYDPMSERKEQIESFVQALSGELGMLILVTDNKSVVIACGKGSKEYVGKDISRELSGVLDKRNIFNSAKSGVIKVIEEEKMSDIVALAVAPIISDSDLMGSLVIMSKDIAKQIGSSELKLLQVGRNFLAKQLE